MIPMELMFLPQFPINSRGKLDRSRLPLPSYARPVAELVPPTNELERRITQILQEVLQRENLSIHDNFFEVGGHSLLVIQVCDRISKTLKREVTPVEMFQHPTIHKMAFYLAQSKIPNTPTPSREASIHTRKSVPQVTSSPAIAIVRMAGRFPGANDIESFWENLKNGVESISLFSDDELRKFGVPEQSLQHPKYLKARGRLKTPFDFDAEFFGYSPREAEFMDPQHRLFLECSHEALEDAGYDPFRYWGNIGIYGGTGDTSYLQHILNNAEDIPATARETQVFFGNYRDFMVTRAAYKLNLKGPAIAVQTACSTSLVAVVMASQALLNGQCDLALAGGCAIRIPHGSLYEEGNITAPDGHCRAFADNAQGTVVGDGVGVIALKRLEDAPIRFG